MKIRDSKKVKELLAIMGIETDAIDCITAEGMEVISRLATEIVHLNDFTDEEIKNIVNSIEFNERIPALYFTVKTAEDVEFIKEMKKTLSIVKNILIMFLAYKPKNIEGRELGLLSVKKNVESSFEGGKT